MPARSKLVRMRIVNIGCIGPEGVTIALDNVLCLVGANNAGKSTILHAYELAVGSEAFVRERDLCKQANGQPASVELWVHIPQGTANIAEKWKTAEDDLLLVRSKWEWSEESNWSVVRRTWDPERGDFSLDDKASGLDTVFSSRLPKPFRIGTLEQPEEEHKKLLMLILQPVADRLKAILADEGSDLNRALGQFSELAQAPVAAEREKLSTIRQDLNRSHKEIFPELDIDFDIGLGEIEIDPIKQLIKNSRLKFVEWASEINWSQQGTGSQRALFWTMLQVRSKLNALSDVVSQSKRDIQEREKQITRLAKEAETAKKDDTKQKKLEQIGLLRGEIEQLQKRDPAALLQEQANQFALPGYMLLIDEPEVALHPGAVRAASKYLYGLADDPAWQVMITTHSPLFINPLYDHTTVVRLDRSRANLTPRTFRSDNVKFSVDEKANLKMLNRFDTGLAEMFFGQYPVLIEGDTEYAAFEAVMNADPDNFPTQARPVLVRARGKWTMHLVIKMLAQFKVPFAILHDADSPRRKDGSANGSWKANFELHKEITEARKAGLRIVHRLSVPNFEWTHLPVELNPDGNASGITGQDKPWNMYQAVCNKPETKTSVKAMLVELLAVGSREEPFDGAFDDGLKKAIQEWANTNAPKDARFTFDDPGKPERA